MNEIPSTKKPKIHPSWFREIEGEFKKPYMASLRSFLVQEKSKGVKIYPPSDQIFTAINITSLDNTKVVIIGQDPYHKFNQAHGLSFSVKPEVKIPPSLMNIFKELNDDLGCKVPNHGFLQSWADQGVLLLNSILSVEEGKPGSHANKGWETFTDKLIEVLNKQKGLVFILWGNYASRKGNNVDGKRHLILRAAHPSPLSSHKGFFGCKHFSKTNNYLVKGGKSPIDWQI
jgi:uracil-DNA glycosylase